jgi:hypothetical protein
MRRGAEQERPDTGRKVGAVNAAAYTVDQCIWIFRGESPDGMTGEFRFKIPILESLTKRLPDCRVLTFFLEVIADPKEDPKSRLYLLKWFEAQPVPVARLRVAASVSGALRGEGNRDVALALARLVARFTDLPETRAVALACALDADDDAGVRLCCLAGLRGADPQTAAALRQLAFEDGPVGRAARERLAEAS